METKEVWWKKLLWLVLVGIIGLIGGYVLFRITDKSPRLEYEIINNTEFTGEKQKTLIYKVEVLNSGNSYVEDINGLISIDNGSIQDYSIQASPAIKIEKIEKFNSSGFIQSIEVKVPYLNPKESFAISIFAFDQLNMPKLSFYIRGSGIVGTEKNNSILDIKGILTVLSVTALLSTLINLIMSELFKRKRS